MPVKLNQEIKFKEIYYSNYMNGLMLTANRNHLTYLSFSDINGLHSELNVYTPEWLRNGQINRTSGSRISLVSSHQIANRKYFDLRDTVRDFHGYYGKRVYGYEITINPSKLNADNVVSVNRKIIYELRKHRQIALIYKAIEHTYVITKDRNSDNRYHASINLHIHYLIVATGRINLKNTYYQVKKIARAVTGSSVNKDYKHSNTKPYRHVDDWHNAENYVTKQCGRFPLMTVHNQWQKFQKLTQSQQMLLLAFDYNSFKGLQIHRLYVNARNSVAKNWHLLKHNQNEQQIHKSDTNAHQKYQKYTNNGRVATLINVPTQSHKRSNQPFTRHHYSEIEALSRLYGYGVYGLEKQPTQVKSISLFESEVRTHAG